MRIADCWLLIANPLFFVCYFILCKLKKATFKLLQLLIDLTPISPHFFLRSSKYNHTGLDSSEIYTTPVWIQVIYITHRFWIVIWVLHTHFCGIQFGFRITFGVWSSITHTINHHHHSLIHSLNQSLFINHCSSIINI